MNLLERDQKYVWHPYTQMKTAKTPFPIVRGAGAMLYDENGNAFIDAVSSWWVNIHGHANNYIRERVNAQFQQLEHVIFSGFTHPPAVDLAERLVKILPSRQKKVFYSDNGSTAVEVGIKMAIQSYYNRGVDRFKIIAFDQAFHGETFGAMSVSGDLSLNNAFKGFLFEVLRIPSPLPGQEEASLKALDEILANEKACAFIFEPLIMGAGGMLMYEPSVLDQLIKRCQEKGVLCIADEVMTGFGRTGKTFACNYLQEQPDIMCLSKGLTGGVMPLAVTTCTQEIFDAFWSDDKGKTFFHGHSYTANPLGCAAALASLDILESSQCQDKIRWIEQSHAQFLGRVRKHPTIRTVRQRGTIVAVEFETGEATSYFNNLRDQLYDFFIDQGVLLRPLGNVIYCMPPYCIEVGELNKVYQVIEMALEKFALSVVSK